MDGNYRQLRADELIKTADRLAQRIARRFPGASLTGVAASVAEVTREAIRRAEAIQRPNWGLRIGLLALAAVVLIVASVVAVEVKNTDLAEPLLGFVRIAQGALIYLGAVIVFFWTLETRLKRARAVKAVHELRALAHIIDMHQLAKDSDRVGDPVHNQDTDGPMTAEAINQYLHYCTELLAVISKIGQLYVQDFPDGTALAAVDQFENLATGLSQKIWQKIIILDRVQAIARSVPQTPQTGDGVSKKVVSSGDSVK